MADASTSGGGGLSPEQRTRVEEIVTRAKTRPPATWKDYVRELAADDDDTRRAVMARLAGLFDSDTIDAAGDPDAPTVASAGAGKSEAPTVARAGAGGSEAPTVATPDDDGSEAPTIAGYAPPSPDTVPAIPGYRMIESIGAGGMGVVWRAEQEDPKRDVAVKVILPGLANRAMLARFRMEANVLGRLVHPGIARIYDAGTADTGAGSQPYFVMEHVNGLGLTEYAGGHELGTRQRLELMARICDAVHHAHQKGVIHRDLKPGNILVTDDEATEVTGARTGLHGVGQPKILDFGVARLTDADVQTTTLQTNVGQLIGTLPYMSPEQAAGDPDELDTRSDVYALGIVTYELLTGQMPYEVRQRLLPEVVRVIQEDDPAPLSSHDRVFRGDVETIIAKALEKDKTRRYQSASDLASDIRRYLNDEPIIARPASAVYQMTKFAKRNRTLVGGAVSVFMVLVAGVIATSLATVRAQAAEQIAQDERAVADEQRVAAESSRAFLVDTLEQMSPQQRGPQVTVAGVFKQREADIDRTPPLVRLALHEMYGRVYRSLGLRDEAVDHLHAAVELGAETLADDHEWLAGIHGWYGSALLDVGRDRDAAQQFIRARDLSGESAVAPQAWLYTTWAFSLHDLGDYDASEFTSRRALDVLGETETMETVQIRNLLVWLAVDRGALDEAEALSADARAMAQRLETDPQFDAFLAMTHGYVLHAQARLADALEAYRASRDGFAEAAQDEHAPPAARASLFIAGLIEDARTLGVAVAATDAERSWTPAEGVIDRRDQALLLRNRARILVTHGAAEAGFALFARSLAVDAGNEDEAAERMAHTHREWSRFLRLDGDATAARPHADAALAIQRERLTGELAVALAPALVERGLVALADGRIDDACTSFDEALAERRRHFAPNEWPLAMTEITRAECLLARGERADAIDTLLRSAEVVAEGLGDDNARVQAALDRIAEMRAGGR